MTKQQKTALNMAKFIQNQSLLLLEKLNELDLDVEADLCEMRSIFPVHCPRDWMHYRMVTDGQSIY
ncbi:Rop family plasmid primer RNA-binding protein (plasmid) [Escherichia coli]|uniref:Rop family plasmid primer RNA-binding protein n=1 Tax=Escherichia coli TaxID=562 RepID=UPI001CCC0FE6|nr:Rop family plasmid primer RNA-binding protein [Escherichia coli]UAO92005.1 Rop family plasmid primer RNA-binding protein [Escherichia coli]